MAENRILPAVLIGSGVLAVFLMWRPRAAGAAELVQVPSPDVLIREGARITPATPTGGDDTLGTIVQTGSRLLSLASIGKSVAGTVATLLPAASPAASAAAPVLTVSQVVGEPALAGVGVPALLESELPALAETLSALPGPAASPLALIGQALAPVGIILGAMGIAQLAGADLFGSNQDELEELQRIYATQDRLLKQYGGVQGAFEYAHQHDTPQVRADLGVLLTGYYEGQIPTTTTTEAILYPYRGLPNRLSTAIHPYITWHQGMGIPDKQAIIISLAMRSSRIPPFDEVLSALIPVYQDFGAQLAAQYQPDTGR